MPAIPLAPLRGANVFPPLSGGLRFASTTGYYLPALRAEAIRFSETITLSALTLRRDQDRNFNQMPSILHRLDSGGNAEMYDIWKELTGETKERRFLKMLGKNYLDAERDKPLLIELLSELDPSTQAAATGGA